MNLRTIFGALLLCSPLLSAASIAVTFGAPPSVLTSGLDATRGWEFSVTSSIIVTQMGLWDENADGLNSEHVIGIFSLTSTLLASAVVPKGVAAALQSVDGFRFVTLGSPLNLTPGTYRIGAHYLVNDGDKLAYLASPNTAVPVRYVGPRLSGIGFQDPTQISAAAGGAFGPNFIFVPSDTVPEGSPASFVTLGLGILGLWRWAKSGKRSV